MKVVEKVNYGNWICEIYEDRGYHFGICRYTGSIRRRPILIPAIEFEMCSEELLEEKYPLPRPLIRKLVNTCKLIVLKHKVKE